jgi:hypothetical protein
MDPQSRSNLRNLPLVEQKRVLDYLIFLLWTDKPLDQCLVIFVQAIYLSGHRVSRPLWLIKLNFFICGLRGLWFYTRLHGAGYAWLRINGAYRC